MLKYQVPSKILSPNLKNFPNLKSNVPPVISLQIGRGVRCAYYETLLTLSG